MNKEFYVGQPFFNYQHYLCVVTWITDRAMMYKTIGKLWQFRAQDRLENYGQVKRY